MHLFAATLVVVSAAGCGGEDSLEDATCPPNGTTLTYASFGRPFLDAHCQSCHASGARERNGAPSGYTFDSPADVQRLRSRIFVRAAGDNVSMPPGPDDPPAADRARLAEWLACGAP